MLRRLSIFALTLLLAACAAPRHDIDYSAFRASKPASILVLPPLNTSVEPEAVAAVLAQATRPLAESGYYVVPVAAMYETFLQNGLSQAEDIHQLPADKLRDIFGADAALYMTVNEYGASYAVLLSTVKVSLSATLVDLRTGARLWSGAKILQQSNNSNSGSLLGMLISAAVNQVVNDLSDASYALTGTVSQQLLGAGSPGGILYGPRSPHYAQQ